MHMVMCDCLFVCLLWNWTRSSPPSQKMTYVLLSIPPSTVQSHGSFTFLTSFMLKCLCVPQQSTMEAISWTSRHDAASPTRSLTLVFTHHITFSFTLLSFQHHDLQPSVPDVTSTLSLQTSLVSLLN